MADKQPDEADWIREIVIKRAEDMGITAYAIAEATGLEVSHDTMKRFLTRNGSIRSDHLSMIFSVLGLDVKKVGK